MTKEIENLVKNIDSCISKRDEMLEEKANLKKTGMNIVLKNYKEIFFPEADELHKLLRSLGSRSVYAEPKKIESNTCLTFDIDERNYLELSPHSYDFSFLFKNHVNGISMGWNYSPEGILETLTSHTDSAPEESTGFVDMLLAFFGTEESTFKVLDFYRHCVAEMLENMHDNIVESNATLAAELKKLQDAINNSRSVIENEDGSVEIQINGKTYIGTVKEA